MEEVIFRKSDQDRLYHRQEKEEVRYKIIAGEKGVSEIWFDSLWFRVIMTPVDR